MKPKLKSKSVELCSRCLLPAIFKLDIGEAHEWLCAGHAADVAIRAIIALKRVKVAACGS
jgi:hypothetical protein